MDGYELKIKLDIKNFKISRTLTVPDTMRFIDLNSIFEIIFDLTPMHLSQFHFEGLITPLWDFTKVSPGKACADMDVSVKDYFDFFKKFYWEYNLSHNLIFTVKVKKAKKVDDYPQVKSYECKYNLLDYRGNDETEYILMDGEFEEFTIFDIDEVNERLKMW